MKYYFILTLSILSMQALQNIVWAMEQPAIQPEQEILWSAFTRNVKRAESDLKKGNNVNTTIRKFAGALPGSEEDKWLKEQNWAELVKAKNFAPGMTPLMIAVSRIDYEDKDIAKEIRMIRFLLDQGAHVNQQDKFGNTVLHYAVLMATVPPYQQPAYVPAYPGVADRIRKIREAQERGVVEAIKELLTNPKSANNINFALRNNDNETAIDMAKKYGLTEIYKMLVESAMEQAKIKKHLTQVPELPALPKEIVEEIYKKIE